MILRRSLAGAETSRRKETGTSPFQTESKNSRASAPISGFPVRMAMSVYWRAVVAL